MKTTKTKISPQELETAHRLRNKGWTYSHIAKALGRDYNTIRAAMDPVYAESRRQAKRSAYIPTPRASAHLTTNVRIVVPPEVEAERDKRINAPRTLSALFFGDPPVGFSALERRGV